MLLRQAEISKHAWDQFVARSGKPRPACYRVALQLILATAQEEDIGYHAVKRMISHRMIPARYWITENWRIVTDEEVATILTIEHPEYRGRLKNEPKRKHRKQKV